MISRKIVGCLHVYSLKINFETIKHFWQQVLLWMPEKHLLNFVLIFQKNIFAKELANTCESLTFLPRSLQENLG